MLPEPNAFDIVSRFSGLRVLVVGDVMLDTYLHGSATRLCKEGPVPVIRRERIERAPGGAGNTAANLAALGASVMLVSLIGTDETGRALRLALQERGVSDDWLVEDPAVETTHKLRIVADGQYVVRFDEGDTRDCTLAARRALQERVTTAFATCDLMVIPDYANGVLSDDLLQHIAALRRERPVVLAVDAKDVTRYRGVRPTVMTPNLAEAHRAISPGNTDAPVGVAAGEQIARQLHRMLDAENMVVTMAGDGVMLIQADDAATHIPAHPVQRAGDVGAGDSFTAAMALALHAGAEPPLAARIGLEAAAIAITKENTAVVRQQELLRRVSLDDRPGSPGLSDLARMLDQRRWEGKTIVFTNGVFDILHAGHVQLLQRARRLGDVLVVGINSDASTRRLKGPTRPINREADRLALVSALEPVDHAVLFDGDTPADVIRVLRPHVHVKGGDYTPDSLPEREAVESVGGRIEILSLVEGRSTTGVIEQIVHLVHAGELGVTP